MRDDVESKNPGYRFAHPGYLVIAPYELGGGPLPHLLAMMGGAFSANIIN